MSAPQSFWSFLRRHWHRRLLALALIVPSSFALGFVPDWVRAAVAGLGVGLLFDLLIVAPAMRADDRAALEHDRDEWKRLAEQSFQLNDEWEASAWRQFLASRELLDKVTGRATKKESMS